MTETTEVPAAAQASPKGKKVAAKKTGSKKASAAPSHPPISQMVNAAIRELKERGGSSTQAIKKYISSNYKIDVDKKSKFIGKYLKSAVTAGTLVQTKGKGASGSFKLAGVGEPKPKVVSKQKRAVKPKKPAAKKAVAKTPPPKKASPSKAKKAKKPPTTPKPPKPKAATKAKAPPAKPKTPKKKPAAAKKKTAAKKK